MHPFWSRSCINRLELHQGKTGSKWILLIDKTVLNSKSLGKMSTQGANPETLGGMVSGGKVVHLQLLGQMVGLLRNLATDITLDTKLSRPLDLSLGGPRAPGEFLDGAGGGQMERRSSQSFRQLFHQTLSTYGLGQR